MKPRFAAVCAALCAQIALAACETTKSSNPLSATVAGPIPGVNITAPSVVAPASGAKIAVDKQPVTLTVTNAETSGVRPLTYLFDVATDANFTNKVFSRDGLAPGDGGRTSLRLPDPLATGRAYFWRTRAEDGANTGPFTAAASFEIFTPIVIEAPGLVAPSPNATASGIRPSFVVNDANRSGPAGAITYLIEVADSETFANKVASWTSGEQSNQTTLTIPVDLQYGKVYYWHVRAADPTTVGPWSPTQAFVTPPAPVVAPPPPSPVPSPIPSGPAGNDGIDLRQVTVTNAGADVATWPVTAAITGLDFASNGVRVDFTRKTGPDRWPDVVPPGFDGPLQYTLWMILNVGGRWYTAGGVEYWFGLDRNGGPPSQFTGNWYYSAAVWGPLATHQPSVGEQVGFFVTAGDQRVKDVSRGHERSNVVVVPFPSDAGAVFRF